MVYVVLHRAVLQVSSPYGFAYPMMNAEMVLNALMVVVVHFHFVPIIKSVHNDVQPVGAAVQPVSSALVVYAVHCQLVQTGSCRRLCVKLEMFVHKVWNVAMAVAVRYQYVHLVLNHLDDVMEILVPLGRYVRMEYAVHYLCALTDNLLFSYALMVTVARLVIFVKDEVAAWNRYHFVRMVFMHISDAIVVLTVQPDSVVQQWEYVVYCRWNQYVLQIRMPFVSVLHLIIVHHKLHVPWVHVALQHR